MDLETGGVRAVRAGHLGPLIRHTDGRTGWPNVRGGLPLGLASVFEQEDFPETRLDLVPGETLVLCTDGLVEEPGTAITQGMEALAHAVRSGPQEAGALADHLSDRLWERWGSGDDVALLVLRRAPDPGTHRAPRIHQYIHQADPEGLSEARYALRQALRDWGMPDLADDVELAAGELLVNALLHTDGGAVLTMEVLPEPVRRIRLWVKDRSSVWPRRRTPGRPPPPGAGCCWSTRWPRTGEWSPGATARPCGASSTSPAAYGARATGRGERPGDRPAGTRVRVTRCSRRVVGCRGRSDDAVHGTDHQDHLIRTDPAVHRLNKRPGKGATTALLALLLAVAVPTAVNRVTGRPHPDPACRTVAFMSMTGAAPACR